ncbi:hypothetical protein W97_08408 [Coniosporium apollinis CBS 100218]|uniref:Uncharacterized protein n=1 Tax=Coniosporium apollinis (strain CBS 100218) TaxID=1168221 RepID=R7Z4K8_CONA1|nr:uncharacterized protein W97_08408 [Coniosporium apollinis CBS 100218]EON69095.1 hypothetical protein W97_08408 [Coniosporium apollinis CBS 100218]
MLLLNMLWYLPEVLRWLPFGIFVFFLSIAVLLLTKCYAFVAGVLTFAGKGVILLYKIGVMVYYVLQWLYTIIGPLVCRVIAASPGITRSAIAFVQPCFRRAWHWGYQFLDLPNITMVWTLDAIKTWLFPVPSLTGNGGSDSKYCAAITAKGNRCRRPGLASEAGNLWYCYQHKQQGVYAAAAGKLKVC